MRSVANARTTRMLRRYTASLLPPLHHRGTQRSEPACKGCRCSVFTRHCDATTVRDVSGALPSLESPPQVHTAEQLMHARTCDRAFHAWANREEQALPRYSRHSPGRFELRFSHGWTGDYAVGPAALCQQGVVASDGLERHAGATSGMTKSRSNAEARCRQRSASVRGRASARSASRLHDLLRCSAVAIRI
jgi:hypothetical protein